MGKCLECNKKTARDFYKYCSNKCQSIFQHKEYVRRWKTGLENGIRGVNARAVSRHLRRYLIEKYGENCALCKWRKRNPTTGSVPLEVDHLDGNSENNLEQNLRLLCPNCHSLTPNFRNLNRGNGRVWRRKKYDRVKTN